MPPLGSGCAPACAKSTQCGNILYIRCYNSRLSGADSAQRIKMIHQTGTTMTIDPLLNLTCHVSSEVQQ